MCVQARTYVRETVWSNPLKKMGRTNTVQDAVQTMWMRSQHVLLEVLNLRLFQETDVGYLAVRTENLLHQNQSTVLTAPTNRHPVIPVRTSRHLVIPVRRSRHYLKNLVPTNPYLEILVRCRRPLQRTVVQTSARAVNHKNLNVLVDSSKQFDESLVLLDLYFFDNHFIFIISLNVFRCFLFCTFFSSVSPFAFGFRVFIFQFLFSTYSSKTKKKLFLI